MPPRPIPKWAQTLGHVPTWEDEDGWAFALQDPTTGLCYGFDIDLPCWCFGTGSGHTFARAALDHLHHPVIPPAHVSLAHIATADPAHVSLALDILRAMGLLYMPDAQTIRVLDLDGLSFDAKVSPSFACRRGRD